MTVSVAASACGRDRPRALVVGNRETQWAPDIPSNFTRLMARPRGDPGGRDASSALPVSSSRKKKHYSDSNHRGTRDCHGKVAPEAGRDNRQYSDSSHTAARKEH